MEYWEFLIQREGDRGWRPIKTGNLQLTEGKYRIVANSNLLETPIQIRVTHQTLGATVPQRRSRSMNQTTNLSGLLAIMPFTHLQSGIWQFVCSGNTTAQTVWHQILKLRVLPRIPTQSVPDFTHPLPTAPLDFEIASAPGSVINRQTPTYTAQIPPHQFTSVEETDDSIAPTEPIIPIANAGDLENLADGLDRLLAQLEWESLHPQHKYQQQQQQQQPVASEILPGEIELTKIVDIPLQLISLDRSTFSGLIPGHQLTIGGACNLQLLTVNLVQTVKIEKIAICLRHPQTAEIMLSIERSLPPNLAAFAFRGQLELPLEPKISLLLGEVNLYDRHHIQIGSRGFSVTLNLNPLHESELSSLQAFDRHTECIGADLDDASDRLDRQLTAELQVEAATIGTSTPSPHTTRFTTAANIKPLDAARYPTVPLAYKRESLYTHPDILPVEPSASSHLHPQFEVNTTTDDRDTDDLEIDRAQPTLAAQQSDRHHDPRNYPNLEIVVDD